jgi:hypothetical protein
MPHLEATGNPHARNGGVLLQQPDDGLLFHARALHVQQLGFLQAQHLKRRHQQPLRSLFSVGAPLFSSEIV